MQGNNFGFCNFCVWLDHDYGSSTAIPCGFMLASVVSHACVERTGGVLAGCGNNLLFSTALFESVRFSMEVYVLCMCGMCFWIDVLFVVF